MNSLYTIFFISMLCITNIINSALPDNGHIYCTSADENHYGLLMSFIGSIHEVDFNNLNQIAVFDLGFTQNQRTMLESIKKVTVYDLEITHPDILNQFITSPWGRTVRGHFAWKPVAIKQMLDMFPYCLYADAGTLILRSPSELFNHIRHNGYFFMDVEHNIVDRITKPVLEKIIYQLSTEQQSNILSPYSLSIDAGFQGVSRTIYDTYVYPIYMLTYDLALFADDSSAPLGFGQARHDQTIFSIYAHILNKTIHPCGWITLNTEYNNIPFHIHWNRSNIESESTIYRCRQDIYAFGDKQQYIHYKN
jgi:hypothetical protein